MKPVVGTSPKVAQTLPVIGSKDSKKGNQKHSNFSSAIKNLLNSLNGQDNERENVPKHLFTDKHSNSVKTPKAPISSENRNKELFQESQKINEVLEEQGYRTFNHSRNQVNGKPDSKSLDTANNDNEEADSKSESFSPNAKGNLRKSSTFNNFRIVPSINLEKKESEKNSFIRNDPLTNSEKISHVKI